MNGGRRLGRPRKTWQVRPLQELGHQKDIYMNVNEAKNVQI